MRGRDFDSVLEVFRLTTTVGTFREILPVYEYAGKIKADRVKYDGRKVVVVGEQYPLYTADYNIRDGNKIKEGWRVRDTDSGVTYEVTATLHDRRNRMITIKCVGVNPNGEGSD